MLITKLLQNHVFPVTWTPNDPLRTTFLRQRTSVNKYGGNAEETRSETRVVGRTQDRPVGLLFGFSQNRRP